jgi:hypothetical protein
VDLFELALLAIASAFWPTLLAVDLVAFRTSRPARLLGWFLAAGLLTTIVEGTVIVFALEGTTLAPTSRRSVGAWGNVIGGLAALLMAYLLKARTAREPPGGREGAKSASWAERVVERGGLYAFVAGVVLNLFPGIFPLVALRNIAALSYSDGVKVLLVVGFYLCMFALVEAPLVGLLLAPERVEPWLQSLNRWLDRNGKRLAIDVLALAGLFLLVRGVVQLATS